MIKRYLGLKPTVELELGLEEAAPEPMAVVFSAVIAALLTLVLLEGLFWLWSKATKK